MFEKITGEIGVASSNDLGKVMRRLLNGYSSEISGRNHSVVFQENGKLLELSNFNLSRMYERGIDLGGSQLLIKGWLKIIRIAEHYPLLVQSGSFGFYHNIGIFGLDKYQDYYSQEKIIESNMIGYIIDQEKLVFYEVVEDRFEGDDPKCFDYFGTKPMILFNGKEEVGYIDGKRTCHLPSPKSKSKIHPMVNCWFQNN